MKHAQIAILALLAAVLTLGECGRPQASERQETDIVTMALRSPNEVALELYCRAPDEQRTVLRRLLSVQRRETISCALQVIEHTFDRSMLPDLERFAERFASENRFPALAPRMKTLADSIKRYEPIAVEGLFPPRPRPADRSSSGDLGKQYRTVPVRLRLVNRSNTPVPNARFQAFAEDFGVCVPYQQYARSNAAGECQLELFPGKWTLVGAVSGEGQGAYVCKPSVTVSDPASIDLHYDTLLSIQFRDGSKPVGIDDVKAIDAGFAGFLEPPELGRSPKGSYVLAVASGRPLTLMATRQPGKDGAAYFFHVPRLSTSSRNEVTLDAKEMGTLTYISSQEGLRAKRVHVWLTANQAGWVDTFVHGELPLKVHVPVGELRAQHWYETENGYALKFIHPAFKVSANADKKVVLGGHLDCSVTNSPSGRSPSVFYQIFVRDANGWILERFWRTGDRQRASGAFDVRVCSGDQELLDTRKRGKPSTVLFDEIRTGKGGPQRIDVDALRYWIEFPFLPGIPFQADGHRPNFEVERAKCQFKFIGPQEAAPWAETWLIGAQAANDSFATSFSESDPDVRRIAIRFSPSVEFAACGNGEIVFNLRFCFEVDHPDRALLTTPFAHELAHKFGIHHPDYMPLAQLEMASREFPDRPLVFIVRDRGRHDSALACLQGRTPPSFTFAVLSLLQARFGYSVFHDYWEKGRPRRNRLWGRGLTESEASCAIFDWLTNGKARPLYRAAGVPIREADVEQGLKLLAEPLHDEKSPAGAASATGAVERALADARNEFNANNKESALRHVDEAIKELSRIGSHRYRASLYLSFGVLLFRHDCKVQAYAMLKECQRAAAKVDEWYAGLARELCLNVLQRGEPCGFLP